MLRVLIDQKEDESLFNKFYFKLNNPLVKRYLLSNYPELKKIKTKKAMNAFISRLYKSQYKRIKEITLDIEKALKKMPKIISIIEEILGEKLETEITVYPTLLPMSPYGPKSFNICILSELRNGKNMNFQSIIEVTSHELSHLIYLKKLRRLFNAKDNKQLAKKIGVSYSSLDGLKEIYAPIIQNHPKLRNHFPHRIYGNPEYDLIKVEYKKYIISIEDYFLKKFSMLEKKKNRELKMLDLLKKIDKEFALKRKLFENIPDRKILTQKGFFDPIKV